MQRLLLIGPNFYYFVESIRRAFLLMGWEVDAEKFDTPIHPYNALNKVRYKLAADKARLKAEARERFSRELFDRYLLADKPPRHDLVFILNGDSLSPELVEAFARKSTVVFWLFDSITRFPEMLANLSHAHHVFCYEKTDIPILSERGIRADFLPQSVDTSLYRPLPGSEKLYDIVFCGDIFVSERRQRLLRAVVEAFPGKRLKFVGQAFPWYKNPWRWLTRPHRSIFTNRSMDGEELNRLYNSARIVLNIHNEQQKDGANPKVYEIAASGAFQVCDFTPYIAQTFPQLALYRSEAELISTLRTALSSAAPLQTQIDITPHTTLSRMREMLRMLDDE